MHAAPSVSHPVGRSRFAGFLLLLLWLAGLAAVAAWASQSTSPGWRQLAGAFAVMAAGPLAFAAWFRSARGVLAWDGAAWTWDAPGLAVATGRPQLVLDWQSRLLLRWRGSDGRARWLWLECKSDADDWDALRRALYSRASTPVPPPGPPPVAEQ
jgi:hypothetical protein